MENNTDWENILIGKNILAGKKTMVGKTYRLEKQTGWKDIMVGKTYWLAKTETCLTEGLNLDHCYRKQMHHSSCPKQMDRHMDGWTVILI